MREASAMSTTAPAAPEGGAVVFDLDGTLVDTAPGMATALNALLADAGRPPLALAAVRRFIGDGITRLVERAFEATGAPAAPAQAAAIGADLSAVLEATPPGRDALYAGVADGVAGLRAAGWRLGVCTNKPQAAAVRALAATRLDPFIDVLIGGGSLAQRKPDPAPLLAAIDRLGATPGTAIYVGDSEVDAATAAAAGVPLILVTYGYLRGPADAVSASLKIDRFSDLGPAVARLAAA